jgi:putative SOS response-associated peptidase YedK
VCTKYLSPDDAAIERYWQIRPGQSWPGSSMFPLALGPFIRRTASAVVSSRECVIGQWGLIPAFAKEAKVTFSTFNARFEELTEKASYKEPWARGQRCIIPAVSFDEPNWESGRNIWWRFTRMDGEPWSLAGLWNTWVDRATGEVHESYTMLTVNADAHPLMRRMHKPDPKYGPDDQDKRSVVAIAPADVDRWLNARPEDVRQLVAPPSVDVLNGAPAETARR